MIFKPKLTAHRPKLECKSDEDFLKGIAHVSPAQRRILLERRQLEKKLIDLIKDPVKPRTLALGDARDAIKKLKELGKHVNRYDPNEGE